MEVLLPPTFDTSKLQITGSSVIEHGEMHAIYIYSVGWTKYRRDDQLKSSPLCDDEIDSLLTNAIFTTRSLSILDNSKTLIVSVDDDGFAEYPNSDYTIIKDKQLYAKFRLEIFEGYDLTTPLKDYNNEPTYKIIRRQVLLVKVVGDMVNRREFQELLSVDCDLLNTFVWHICLRNDIHIDDYEIPEQRPILLLLLHSRLILNRESQERTASTEKVMKELCEQNIAYKTTIETLNSQLEKYKKLESQMRELLCEIVEVD